MPNPVKDRFPLFISEEGYAELRERLSDGADLAAQDAFAAFRFVVLPDAEYGQWFG